MYMISWGIPQGREAGQDLALLSLNNIKIPQNPIRYADHLAQVFQWYPIDILCDTILESENIVNIFVCNYLCGMIPHTQ